MRRLRMLALIVLIGQLLLTESNLYREIDPFGMIFNFYSKYWMGWVLVTIVIVSSIVLYRPFCRTLCPVGLILGWTAKIPGASLLGIRTNCISCVQCSRKCSIKAISHDTRISILENQDCIRCGECLDHCSKSALGFFRKNQKHPDVVTMERVPPLKQDIPVNRAYETVYQ